MSTTYPVPVTLSPSRVTSFQDCALQFRFANIQNLPQPPGIHAVKGNVVHRALELLLALSADKRTELAAHEFMARARREYESMYDFTGLKLTSEQADKFWNECTLLIAGYLKMEDPRTVNAIEIELWVEAPLDGFSIRGLIDRLERDDLGRLVITDYKSGKSPRSIDVDSKMQQLQMYAYMVRAMRGELPATLQLLYIKDGVRHTRSPSEQSMQFVVTRTSAMYKAIERACVTGTFVPRKSGLCNFCNFKKWCPEFGGNPDLAEIEAPLLYSDVPRR
ncbi:MAG: PD-(D/E)XK nuclease family protein [Ilumatobacteraceae bacterium]